MHGIVGIECLIFEAKIAAEVLAVALEVPTERSEQ